ncbi:NAD(P)-dependent oxidoreductase [candidate division SR1 bacterium]|nr:NAD(P)-dependent oxidoreductase [candidate division SR1 bacterium]
MMKKILLTGANGMLAYDFQKFCGQDFEIVGMDVDQLDITSLEAVKNVLIEVKPDVVLNLAAYTNVDEAEDSGRLLNYQVNTLGVYNLAKITTELGIDLISISSDYVFSGEFQRISSENTREFGRSVDDACNPVNAYGMAKILGEQLGKAENKNLIIVRTSWLYGGGPQFKNFVNTMLKLFETKDEIKVVNDQFGLPTYTKDLSLALQAVIERIEDFRGQILHFSNGGDRAINWFDFAKEINKLSTVKILPCGSDEFPTKAKRPKFSRLLNESEIQLRDWREGVEEYVKSLEE